MITFLISPWVFYSLVPLFFILITWLHDEEDHLGWSFILLAGLVFLIANKFSFGWLDIRNNLSLIIKYLVCYLAIGVIWGFVKWYFFLKNIINIYEDFKIECQNEWNELTNGAKNKYKDFKGYLYEYWKNDYKLSKKLEISRNYELTEYKVTPPSASDNKLRITSWIAHWPISAIWTIINDPVRKFINHIFNYFKGLFQRISNYIFKDVIKDFS